MPSTSPRLSFSLSPSRQDTITDTKCGRSLWTGPAATPYHSAALSALSYSLRGLNPKPVALISMLASIHLELNLVQMKASQRGKKKKSHTGTRGQKVYPRSRICFYPVVGDQRIALEHISTNIDKSFVPSALLLLRDLL